MTSRASWVQVDELFRRVRADWEQYNLEADRQDKREQEKIARSEETRERKRDEELQRNASLAESIQKRNQEAQKRREELQKFEEETNDVSRQLADSNEVLSELDRTAGQHEQQRLSLKRKREKDDEDYDKSCVDRVYQHRMVAGHAPSAERTAKTSSTTILLGEPSASPARPTSNPHHSSPESHTRTTPIADRVQSPGNDERPKTGGIRTTQAEPLSPQLEEHASDGPAIGSHVHRSCITCRKDGHECDRTYPNCGRCLRLSGICLWPPSEEGLEDRNHAADNEDATLGPVNDSSSPPPRAGPRTLVVTLRLPGTMRLRRRPEETKRTVRYEDVLRDVTNLQCPDKHWIVQNPSNLNEWYILRCVEHGLNFGEHAFRAAGRHLDRPEHGFLPRNNRSAIKNLGWLVLGCDSNLAATSNAEYSNALRRGYKPINIMDRKPRDVIAPSSEDPSSSVAPRPPSTNVNDEDASRHSVEIPMNVSCDSDHAQSPHSGAVDSRHYAALARGVLGHLGASSAQIAMFDAAKPARDSDSTAVDPAGASEVVSAHSVDDLANQLPYNDGTDHVPAPLQSGTEDQGLAPDEVMSGHIESLTGPSLDDEESTGERQSCTSFEQFYEDTNLEEFHDRMFNTLSQTLMAAVSSLRGTPPPNGSAARPKSTSEEDGTLDMPFENLRKSTMGSSRDDAIVLSDSDHEELSNDGSMRPPERDISGIRTIPSLDQVRDQELGTSKPGETPELATENLPSPETPYTTTRMPHTNAAMAGQSGWATNATASTSPAQSILSTGSHNGFVKAELLSTSTTPSVQDISFSPLSARPNWNNALSPMLWRESAVPRGYQHNGHAPTCPLPGLPLPGPAEILRPFQIAATAAPSSSYNHGRDALPKIPSPRTSVPQFRLPSLEK